MEDGSAASVPPRRGRLRRAGATASEHAAAAAFGAGWRLVGRLPERRAQALFARAADRIHAADGAGVRRLRVNLASVRPDLGPADLEELTHAGVRSYLRYWCESFRLPSWPLEDLVARTSTVHEERLRAPYAQGRGVVVALPHQANWDWAGAWASGTGMPVTTVAERLRPERLYDEFVAFRGSLGMTILPLTGGAPPLPALLRTLREGGFVCLLADRELGAGGVAVTLCDRRAKVPGGPAMLARRTGAALVPMTLAYGPGTMELTFHEEVTVGAGREGLGAATQQVADAFTAGLRAHPQDWHMMQPVFLDDAVDDAVGGPV